MYWFNRYETKLPLENAVDNNAQGLLFRCLMQPKMIVKPQIISKLRLSLRKVAVELDVAASTFSQLIKKGVVDSYQ